MLIVDETERIRLSDDAGQSFQEFRLYCMLAEAELHHSTKKGKAVLASVPSRRIDQASIDRYHDVFMIFIMALADDRLMSPQVQSEEPELQNEDDEIEDLIRFARDFGIQ